MIEKEERDRCSNASLETDLKSRSRQGKQEEELLASQEARAKAAEAAVKRNKMDCVGGGREDKIPIGSCSGNVFGPVPSRIEVENAMSDLQRFMLGLSATELVSNGLQQMLSHCDPNVLQSFGYRIIRDAFRMLQTELSVQRMVISISSDKAVWDAISNNKAVQDLRGSIYQVLHGTDNSNLGTSREERPRISNNKESVDIANLILKWILGITISKIGKLIEKFVLLVIEIFQPAGKEKPTSELTDLLEEKVGSSFVISVVILFIVVVTRSHGV